MAAYDHDENLGGKRQEARGGGGTRKWKERGGQIRLHATCY